MQLQTLSLARKLTAVLIFASLALLAGHELEFYLPELEDWIKSFGVFAPLGFILLFTLISPAFVSVDALSFAAGVLFPLMTAEWVVIIATYLSAAVIFMAGRHFVRAKVMAFIAGHTRFATLDKAISGGNAFKLMLLLRLTPLPFALLGYALSATGVKFWPYIAATSGILIYNGSLAYLGYATKHLTGLARGSSGAGLVSPAMLVVGLLILIPALIYIAKTAGHTLKEMSLENSCD